MGTSRQAARISSIAAISSFIACDRAVAGYGRSKTAHILFAVEFDRRHGAAGVGATAVHPGGIATSLAATPIPSLGLCRSGSTSSTPSTPPRASPSSARSNPQGAATSVWAGVVAPAEAVGGRYCENCHVAELLEGEAASAASEGLRSYALDPERAKALGSKSEERVGRALLIGARLDDPAWVRWLGITVTL